MCVCHCRPKVHVYYAAEGAFYAASVGMLLGWEERRRDFLVMLLHHVTTCALIAASYMLGCAALLLQCPAKLLHNLSTLQKLTTCALVAATFPLFPICFITVGMRLPGGPRCSSCEVWLATCAETCYIGERFMGCARVRYRLNGDVAA